jgi:hypothetical protein
MEWKGFDHKLIELSNFFNLIFECERRGKFVSFFSIPDDEKSSYVTGIVGIDPTLCL